MIPERRNRDIDTRPRKLYIVLVAGVPVACWGDGKCESEKSGGHESEMGMPHGRPRGTSARWTANG